MARSSAKPTTQYTAVDSHPKRPKLSIGDDTSGTSRVDRISNLPDSLLCQILSLLPTKYAVATSILSTRWKYLWTSVSNLDFDDMSLPHRKKTSINEMEKMKYINFVNKVLDSLNPPFIQKFHLKCGQVSDVFHVNTWISDAVSRNVREINLFIFLERPIELPRSLFTCETLEVLKLDGDIVFNTPAAGSVCFPNLKILSLVGVKYANDDCVGKLLISCPVLEHLVIRNTCRLSCIEICAPALKRLEINGINSDFPEDCACKIQIVFAPSLKCLYIINWNVTDDFLIENLISLVEAEVDVYSRKWLEGIDDGFGYAVLKLLRGLSGVKRLYLSFDIVRALSNGYQFIVPAFRNLTWLEVEVSCRYVHVLQSLLENSDNLRHLVCTKGRVCTDINKSWWSEPENVPKCLLTCLTTIRISEFHGCVDEFMLVRYFLKNAQVLDKMTIKTYLKVELKIQVLQKISMFPRGSEMCEIAFP